MLILATTNQRSILDQMEMGEAFNAEIRVPSVTDLTSVDRILQVQILRKLSKIYWKRN